MSNLVSAMALPDTDGKHVSDGEDALIDAARQGDGHAYRKLVEPHIAMLHRIATRVSGNQQLAEDAVQETLTLCYRRLDRYQPRSSFKSFLAAVAARQAHTLARAERRRLRREDAAAAPEHAPNPEQALGGSLVAQRVRAALLAMPKKRRSAAILRLDAGLSYREIAETLNTTEGSARVLVHKVLTELRSELADLIGGPLADDLSNARRTT